MRGRLFVGLFCILLSIVAGVVCMSNRPDDPGFWRTDVADGMDLIHQIGEQVRQKREEEELERVRRDPVLQQRLLPAVPMLLDPAHPTTVASLPVWVKWIYLVARRSIR